MVHLVSYNNDILKISMSWDSRLSVRVTVGGWREGHNSLC